MENIHLERFYYFQYSISITDTLQKGKKAQVTGANAVSIDEKQRRGTSRRSPVERGLRRNRSRSDERLLPPQALQQKNPPTISTQRQSSERSNKNSRERSLPLKSPERQLSHLNEQLEDEPELSAEEFSDIGDSGEEFLNQENDKKEDVQDSEDETQHIDEKDGLKEQDDSNDQANSKESDLLEGISEEEFELSDEEQKEEKVKLADALGVDWSALQSFKTKELSREIPRSFRNKWTPAAIFSRIGLPKSLMKPGHYDKVLEEINKDRSDDEKIQMCHPIAAIHAFYTSEKERERLDSLKRKPALSARSDLQNRRKLLGLPTLIGPIKMNIYQ